MNWFKIKKHGLLLLVASLCFVYQVKAQELSTDDAGNNLYSNEKYHFNFSFPTGYTLHSIRDCDFRWIIQNDEGTFGLNMQILKLNGTPYEAFIKDFADDFIAQVTKQNNANFSSNTHSVFGKQHDCPVPGFNSDGMVYSLETAMTSFKLGINVLKKTSSTAFADDGLLFTGFQDDDATMTKQVVDMIEHTIRFTKPANLTVAATKPAVIAVGSILPDFTQTDTEGTMVSLSSLKGKFVLVNFWASWSSPCRLENPNIVSAYNQFKNKNFSMLGISLDKDKKAWIDAINKDSLTWTQLSDLQGWSNAVALQCHAFSVPANYLIDPQGKIIAMNLRGPALLAALKKFVK